MMDASSFAVAGLRASSVRAAARAENIANANTDGYHPAVPQQTAGPAGPQVHVARAAQGQTVDPITNFVLPQMSLEGELVDLSLAKTAYKANASVLRASGEMTDALLDILT